MTYRLAATLTLGLLAILGGAVAGLGRGIVVSLGGGIKRRVAVVSGLVVDGHLFGHASGHELRAQRARGDDARDARDRQTRSNSQNSRASNCR
jgi:hypothetical protein